MFYLVLVVSVTFFYTLVIPPATEYRGEPGANAGDETVLALENSSAVSCRIEHTLAFGFGRYSCICNQRERRVALNWTVDPMHTKVSDHFHRLAPGLPLRSELPARG